MSHESRVKRGGRGLGGKLRGFYFLFSPFSFLFSTSYFPLSTFYFRLRRWWGRQDRRYGHLRWRLLNGATAALLVFTLLVPIVQQWNTNRAYALNAVTKQLVGQTNQALVKQLTYDAKGHQYQFNKDALQSSMGGQPGSPPPALFKNSTGTAAKNKQPYALDVPTNLSQGVTYHDTNSQLSFKLVPQFTSGAGRQVDGHLVYPLPGGRQAIYTLKNNGLKEDIVVPAPAADTMTFSYSLQLPQTLEAKVIPGSDGAIGIYSADPALFGNISYGSPADQKTVEQARVAAAKNYLVFGLPAPIIKAPGGGSVGSASARFVLNGTTLQVVAEGLGSAHTPITIDPSVVFTSSSDFQTAGNNEGMIDFSTPGQITRGGLTGGTTGAWGATTSFTTGRELPTSVAYNGYIYLLGGYSGAPLNDVQYAPINANGTVGAWAATTSFPTARYGHTSVVYNGYLYVMGGYNGTAPVNDVQYAPINANGTVGAWTATTSFPTARYYHASFVYNGYIYILGGYNGVNLNDVQYAPINANGTVGAWTATTSFPTARYLLSVAVYNGYLYIMGGTSSAPLNDVQYAPINANGTVGAWAATTSFNTARTGFGAFAYNGYLYIMGGTGAATFNDVQYAPINANGTVGAWAATTSFNTARSDFDAIAYNGYLYILGGANGGTYYNDVQYSKIDPAGMNAPWTATTATPVATRDAATVAYNGYIYQLGGYTTAAVNTVHYAPIITGTNSGQIQPGTTLTAGIAPTYSPSFMFRLIMQTDGNLVIYNGDTAIWSSGTGGNPGAFAVFQTDGNFVIYSSASAVLWQTATAGKGGTLLVMQSDGNLVIYTASGTALWASGTSRAMPADLPKGNLGAWASTPSFSGVRYYTDAFVANGYMYIGGGNNGKSGGGNVIYNDVQYAPINVDGTLGGWTATTSFTTGRESQSFYVYANYAYVAGGYSGTASLGDVQYAPINSNGTVGTWVATTSLPAARDLFGSGRWGNKLYVVGGELNGTAQTAVYYAAINSNGTVGTWVATTSLPAARVGLHAAVYNGYLYEAGGFDGTAVQNDVHYARINNDGSIGTWQTGNSFATARRDAGMAISGGNWYLVNGDTGGGTNTADVQFTPINNGGDGTANPWSSTSSFANPRSNPATVVYNGYMYIMGGNNGSTYYADTQYAPINANGTVGAWTATTSFTNGRYAHTAVAYNGYMYIMGGYDGTTYYNDVQYAPINANGTVGAWTATTSFTNGREFAISAAYNGYLYIMGGSASGYYNDVQYAPINANGTVGAWTATTSFPNTRNGFGGFIYNKYLYVLGGYNGARLNDVEFAPINANGTVGAWTATTQMLLGNNEFFSAVYNGFLYVTGGYNTATTNAVQYVPINADGTLGTWQSTYAFNTVRYGHTAVAYNGYLYIQGGWNGSVNLNDTQFTPLNSIARVGNYSKLVDLGNTPNLIPTSLTYNGQLLNGLGDISFQTAGANGVFGASTAAQGFNGSGLSCTQPAAVRYVRVSVTLNDLGPVSGAAFPDGGVTPANLTDFTLNYKVGHAPPNMRLRAGQTLQQGSLSPLDTCRP